MAGCPNIHLSNRPITIRAMCSPATSIPIMTSVPAITSSARFTRRYAPTMIYGNRQSWWWCGTSMAASSITRFRPWSAIRTVSHRRPLHLTSIALECGCPQLWFHPTYQPEQLTIQSTNIRRYQLRSRSNSWAIRLPKRPIRASNTPILFCIS